LEATTKESEIATAEVHNLRLQHRLATDPKQQEGMTAGEYQRYLGHAIKEIPKHGAPYLDAQMKQFKALKANKDASKHVEIVSYFVTDAKAAIDRANFEENEDQEKFISAQKNEQVVRSVYERATGDESKSRLSKRTAENMLNTTERQLQSALLAIRQNKYQEKRIRRKVKETLIAIREAKGRSSHASVEMLEGEKDLDKIMSQKPLPSIAIPHSLTEAPTPVPPPTPPPTTILSMISSPGKDAVCMDKPAWADKCEHLEEHCGTFMTLRIFCRDTCKMCKHNQTDTELHADMVAMAKKFRAAKWQGAPSPPRPTTVNQAEMTLLNDVDPIVNSDDTSTPSESANALDLNDLELLEVVGSAILQEDGAPG